MATYGNLFRLVHGDLGNAVFSKPHTDLVRTAFLRRYDMLLKLIAKEQGIDTSRPTWREEEEQVRRNLRANETISPEMKELFDELFLLAGRDVNAAQALVTTEDRAVHARIVKHYATT